MNEIPLEPADITTLQEEFERITSLVLTEFQIEESMLEHGVPTYYLKQPQETKQPFLNLLKKLDEINFIAVLRKIDGRIVLKVIKKPATKKSNIIINWVLFLATIATTFITGYLLSEGLTDPVIGGATFTISLMTILGLHELGHKLIANKKGIEATPPYFIPGPPPIGEFLGLGTFGAVILQKSLPPNKDALFDIGSSGPILSFILASLAAFVGLLLSPIMYSNEQLPSLPIPLMFLLLVELLINVPPAPPDKPYTYILLHPVAVAGWAGIFVTMLNLMPAAVLDGGHIARAIFGRKVRIMLTMFSVLSLAFISPVMAIFVLFMSMYGHPGPLDDVSSLSKGRKFLAVFLVIIFVLSSFLHYLVFLLFDLFGF
ncbi:MAG: site-2 protease family protein [Candidatus Bathyarchaeia archaeon]